MWLFTKHGFFSMTVSRLNKAKIQIRAREKQDLVNLMNDPELVGMFYAWPVEANPKEQPLYEIIETPQADYRWRILFDRRDFPNLLSALASTVDYSNFKAQIADKTRHGLYERVWALLLALQPPSVQPPLFSGFTDEREPFAPGSWETLFPNEDIDEDEDPNSPFYDPGRGGAVEDDDEDWLEQ